MLQTYSGFYKTRIEPHICHAECLFGLLGYKLNDAKGQYEITGIPPPQQRLTEMAFEFYIAGIECEICHAVSCKADDVNTADVYHCRSRCAGTISTCVQKLQETQNARSSWHSTSAHLTTADNVERLKLAAHTEYLAQISTHRFCDTESVSTVNNSTEDTETLGKVFAQSSDVPATRDEHIARSIQSCTMNDRIQQQNSVAVMADVTDGQHRAVSEVHVLVNEDVNENRSHARPTSAITELHKTVNRTKEIWACSSCTFINAVTVNICEMCFSLR